MRKSSLLLHVSESGMVEADDGCKDEHGLGVG